MERTLSSLRSLLLAGLLATVGCAHQAHDVDSGPTDATVEGAVLETSTPTAAVAVPVPPKPAVAAAPWRPAMVVLPGGASGRISVRLDAATNAPDLCLITNGQAIALSSCDGVKPIAKLIGAAPARPQGPVANPADIGGDYIKGLFVLALEGVPLGWDASALPSVPGYLYNPADGGASTFQTLPITALDAGGTGASLAPGGLGTCLGFVDAGGGNTQVGLVACGTGGIDGGGITQLTGDTVAGPGTGSQHATTGAIWGENFLDGGTNPPTTQNAWIWSGTAWSPAMVNLASGVQGTLPAANGGTGIGDAGVVSGLCLVTNGSGGYVVQACPPGTYGLDIAANPDGGAGQVVGSLHGFDGGAVQAFVPGIAVDRGQPSFTISEIAPADAATAPAGIILMPAPPNAAAATTAGGTPGGVLALLSGTVSTGQQPGFVVAIVDGGADGGQLNEGQIGPLANGSANSCLWVGLSGATPSSSNGYCGIGGTLSISAPVTNGQITVNGGSTSYLLILGQSATYGFTGTYNEESAFGWIPTVTSPRVFHATRNGDTATTSLTIQAQNAFPSGAAANKNGAALVLAAGESSVPGTWGIGGPVQVDVDGNTVIEAAEPVLNHRGVALGQVGTGMTSSNSIVNGDGWTWFAPTHAAPTTAPIAGSQCWSDVSTNNLTCWNAGAGSSFVVGAGGGGSATGVYGNGADGAYVLDGSTNFAPLIQLVSPNIYGFNADVFATTVVVNSGVFVEMNGYILHASGSVTVQAGGTLDANSGNEGNNGLSGSGGAGGSVGNTHGTLGGGFAGGAGGLGSAGSNGATTNSSWVLTSTFQPPNGGPGGNAGGTSGGAGSTTAAVGCRTLSLPGAALGTCTGPQGGVYGVYQIKGGGGGGGGASLGAGGAGGGGGSAGVGVIASPTIVNSGLISSNGGQGGNGFVGTGSGGGGGGAGGLIYLITGSFTGSAPNVTGGVGGSGASGGAAGTTGDTGYVVHLGP